MYNKDLIAERDKKEKMFKSVIKWWNVHYMTPEELEAEEKKQLIAAYDPGEIHFDEDVNSQGAGQDDSVPEDNGMSLLTDEQAAAAAEIIARLNAEAAEDEAAKQMEIEAARASADANYNATTGSMSGAYGSEGIKEEFEDQIGSILGEKDDYLKKMIQEAGEN